MGKNFLLLSALVVSIIILVLHLLALKNFLYWAYGGFDVLVHALAGVMIGFVSVWVLSLHKSIFLIKTRKIFLIIFTTTLVVSVLWEIFEFVFKLTFVSSNYTQDTILDIVMTVVGGFLIFLTIFLSPAFLKEKQNAE